jgi:hypothetical protein
MPLVIVWEDADEGVSVYRFRPADAALIAHSKET